MRFELVRCKVKWLMFLHYPKPFLIYLYIVLHSLRFISVLAWIIIKASNCKFYTIKLIIIRKKIFNWISEPQNSPASTALCRVDFEKSVLVSILLNKVWWPILIASTFSCSSEMSLAFLRESSFLALKFTGTEGCVEHSLQRFQIL